MEIFIGNLPPATSTRDLNELVYSALYHRSILNFFLRAEAQEFQCRIYEKETIHGFVNYGIATIKPDRVAKLVATRLNKLHYMGNELEAREYFKRGYMNERRSVHWREKSWHNEERRGNDRRKTLQHRHIGETPIEVGEITIGEHTSYNT